MSYSQLRAHARDMRPLFNWRGEIFPYIMTHLAVRETNMPTAEPKKDICSLCGISYAPPERLQTHARKEHPLFNPRRRPFPFTRSHEKRIANDIMHNISRDIVNQAINTNAIIVLGDIKQLRRRKQNTRGKV